MAQLDLPFVGEREMPIESNGSPIIMRDYLVDSEANTSESDTNSNTESEGDADSYSDASPESGSDSSNLDSESDHESDGESEFSQNEGDQALKPENVHQEPRELRHSARTPKPVKQWWMIDHINPNIPCTIHGNWYQLHLTGKLVNQNGGTQ